jgi:hypothetical protein
VQKFKHYITFASDLSEAAYPNNIGFAEMVKFYQIANSSDIKKMEIIIKNEDWDGFKMLIKKVTGEKLQ